MGGRKWTEDEIQKLEDLSGTFTVATIAKRLDRSFDAVNIKMNRLGILGFEKSTDLLTMNQLCIMLGVSSRTVKKKWAGKGLKIMRKGNYIVVKQERSGQVSERTSGRLECSKHPERRPAHGIRLVQGKEEAGQRGFLLLDVARRNRTEAIKAARL